MVTGSVDGRFAVFEKLAKLHAKNSFSLAIVLGDLFADPAEASEENEETIHSLLKGKFAIPIATYFTLGKHPLPKSIEEKIEVSDGEICPNLYFLGKCSTTKTSEGLRIVTLGGQLDKEVATGVSKDKCLPIHTEGDANSLQGAKNADILVTSYWPASVRSRSNVELTEDAEEPPSEQCLADLCSALKPRYHFSNSPQLFYEREPFFHVSEDLLPDKTSITRFISLAAYDNPSKQKWLYAFSIDPNAATPLTMPPGTTATPFISSKKRQRLPDQEQSYTRFSRNGGGDNYRPKKRSRHQPPPGPNECFFCLSNPNLATHLITSIGNDAYLTTAKGPLSTATTYPTLPFPAHILIIPLSHSPTLSSITPTDAKISTHKEMQQYRRALHSLLTSSSKGSLGAVTWEVSRAEGIHLHYQFLPLPNDLIKRGLVEAAFKVEAENEKYPTTFKAKTIGDGTPEQGDYFRVWIWNPGEGVEATLTRGDERDGGEVKGEERELVLPLTAEFRFDLQFGRRVMAKLLGLGGRMDWRDCTQEEAEEKTDAEGFKAAFKPFDFSIDEG